MWGSNKRNNFRQDFPETLIEKYPMLNNLNNYAYNTTAYQEFFKEESGIIPVYPMLYREWDGREAYYLTTFMFPLIFNGFKIKFTHYSDHVNKNVIEAYTENTKDQDLYILLCECVCDETIIKHKQFTDLIGLDTYVADYSTVIIEMGDDNARAYQYYNKIVAVLSNWLLSRHEQIQYPIPDKLYDDMFNYKVADFINDLCAWFDTWMPEALIAYNNSKYERIINNFVQHEDQIYNAKINDCKTRINDLEQNLEETYHVLHKYKALYSSFKYDNSNTKAKKLVELFKHCNNLIDIDPRYDQSLVLHMRAPLINYDIDLAERWCKEDNNVFSYNNIQDRMYKLLVSGKYTLMFECQIIWDFNYGGTVSAIRGGRNYVYCPQPHIDRYSCFGDNKAQIVRALSDYNFELALDCTNAAVSSLNLLDGAVMDYLLDWMENNLDKKTIMNNETGEIVSIREVDEDDSIVREH